MIQTVRDGLERFRGVFIRHIYRGPIKTFLNKTGLDGVLSRLYYRVISPVEQHLADEQEETVQTVEIGGESATFRVSSPIEQDIVQTLDQVRESEILRDLFDEIEDGDVFYDVGAHIGLYSCFVGTHECTVEIVCFEPHPVTYDQLKQNLRDNDVDAKVNRYAMSNENGELRFEIKRNTSGGMGVVSDTGDVSVQSRTLDSVVHDDGLPHPTVLKCDIEGEELNFLHGADMVLSNPRTRLLYLEVHPIGLDKRGHSEAELRELLREFGYDSFETIRSEERSSYHLKVTRED